MIRFMTELFPIIPAPLWMKNKSQPIAIQNVIDYLIAALTNKNGQAGVFEIGSPMDVARFAPSDRDATRVRLKRPDRGNSYLTGGIGRGEAIAAHAVALLRVI